MSALQPWKSAEAEANDAKAEAIAAVRDQVESILELLPEDATHEARAFRAKLNEVSGDYAELAGVARGS